MAQPLTWAEALAAKAEQPALLPIAGGTDVMVEINFDRRRPQGLLDLTRLAEVASWSVSGDTLVIGAGVTYAQVVADLADLAPGLAMASRTVGSPQIRNRGTIAGNLGSASPAGDAHPPLLAANASVEVESVRGRRTIPVGEFFTGVKRNALEPDELIRVGARAGRGRPAAVLEDRHPQRDGDRGDVVRARPAPGSARRVGTGIGSAAPTPVTAPEAASFLEQELDWDGRAPLDEGVVRRFGELVAAAASPIDDVRGTAAYRRHALAVMARRTLGWAWSDYRSPLEGEVA